MIEKRRAFAIAIFFLTRDANEETVNINGYSWRRPPAARRCNQQGWNTERISKEPAAKLFKTDR